MTPVSIGCMSADRAVCTGPRTEQPERQQRGAVGHQGWAGGRRGEPDVRAPLSHPPSTRASQIGPGSWEGHE